MAIAVETKLLGDNKAPVLWPDPEHTGQPGPHTCAGEIAANPTSKTISRVRFLKMISTLYFGCLIIYLSYNLSKFNYCKNSKISKKRQ
jgi:hypothetical protein